MTVGIAVPTTVASIAPRVMPSSRPAVIARRRVRVIGGCGASRRILPAYTPRMQRLLLLTVTLLVPSFASAATCESLTSLSTRTTESRNTATTEERNTEATEHRSTEGTEVTFAQTVAAGAFTPPPTG